MLVLVLMCLKADGSLLESVMNFDIQGFCRWLGNTYVKSIVLQSLKLHCCSSTFALIRALLQQVFLSSLQLTHDWPKVCQLFKLSESFLFGFLWNLRLAPRKKEQFPDESY